MFINDVRELREESKFIDVVNRIKNTIVEAARKGSNSTILNICDLYIDRVIEYLESEKFLCNLKKSKDNSSLILTVSW